MRKTTICHLGTSLALAVALTTPALAEEQPADPAATTAQDGTNTNTNTNSDIIVTATRRETMLQTTPVAITAVDAKTFEDLGARKIEDLARHTPGLFVQQATFSGAGGPSIRGIGSFSLIASASFPVAFYYDGLFQDRPFGNNLRLFDINRIEVLRGPQGVLFGRNATAGAIRVEFALPTDQFALRARLAAGSFGSYEGQFSVRGPVADGIKLGLSGTYAESDGYGTNRFNNTKVYGYSVRNIRSSAVLDPAENLKIILRGGYTKQTDTFGLKQVFAGPTGAVITANNQNIALFGPTVLGIDEFANNFPSYNTVERYNASAEVTVGLGNFDLVGLFGYNKSSNVSDSDTDGGDNVLFIRPTSIFNHTENRYQAKSAEIRLSSTGWDSFKLDAGFYYINEEVNDAGSRLRFVNLAGVTTVGSETRVSFAKTDAWALFAHGAYDLSDTVTARAGIRYSDERKNGAAQAFNLVTNTLLPQFTAGTSDTAWTPSFGLDFKISPTTFLFANVAKGFKSGGFTVDPNTGVAVKFKKETVWSYEVGVKTDLLDRHLRINAAAFYTDYTDLQVTQNLPNGGAQTSNAASARVYGVELETVLRPVQNLTISGSLAYLDAKYRDYLYIPNTPTFNLAGYRLDRAPEWKGSIVAEWVIPTSFGKLALQGSYTYEDEVSFHSVPDSPVALVGPPPSPAFERSRLYTRRAISLIDGRIELTLPGERISVALYGTNLTNTRYFGALTRLGGGTSTIGNVNQPRAFRFEIGYKY